MTYRICYLCLCLAFPLLLLLSTSKSQESFSFPSPVANSDSFSNYASHDTPTWHDFADFVNHPVYGGIGASVGRLNLSYEGQDSFELHDGGNCTATIISERLLITNAHCVYSPRYSPDAGEDILLKNLSLAMDAHAANDTGDIYPVKIKPIEINETLDFAILEFAAASPYEKYGAVDLRNHRSAQVGESLFMIHHSNITGYFDGNNYKRITESNCTRLNESQFEGSDIPIFMPDEESKRPVNPAQDIPHFCDSEQGSSGSLIYARDDSAVVGLHFSGRNARDEADRFNLYIDIEVICSQSRVLQRFCTQQQGAFAITSSPNGATVSIDGRVIGTTPLNESAYDAGVYRLSLDYNGYETYSESIRISAGQTLQRNITLEAREPEIIRTVAQLERRAKEGGTLKLAAVTFHLDAPLELSGDVVLLGEGYEETRIVSSAPEYVVRYTGGGTFVAQGIGFEHVGEKIADVVRVDAGTLNIKDCQFTGGYSGGEIQGSGLWIKDSAQGTVRDSIFNSNGLNGIEVSNAQPSLERNRLYDNKKSGIYYGGTAGGSAISNESYGNGLSGIMLKDNTQPKLEENRLHDNTESGIAYFDSAGGSAMDNESYSNGSNGIYIGDDAEPIITNNGAYQNKHRGIRVGENAQPILEQNRLHNNAKSGIAYFDSAGGSAVSNESYGNTLHGISVQNDAQPRLERNHLYQNNEIGIRYSGTSNGSAISNKVYGNMLYGMLVIDNAKPLLENNEIYDNKYDGILVGGSANPMLKQNSLYDNLKTGVIYLDLASGTAISNEIYDNGDHGIIISDNASPILEKNLLRDNTLSGIAYGGSASGSALGNESHDNGMHGISLQDNAKPTLRQNRLHHNSHMGIICANSAGGEVIDNASYNNGVHGISMEDNTQAILTNNEVYSNTYSGIQVINDAQPILERNLLYDNIQSGILYAYSAGGSAIDNESYGNGLHGIGIQDNATPLLQQNRLHNNTKSGIAYLDLAGGSAVDNQSYNNGEYGILIINNAQPTLEQNRLHDNTYAGILYSDSASGSALNNESYNNRWGIYIYETANPTLSNNTAYNNPDGDIVDER